MEIKTLSATFGRLENETLSLSPGLNVIEAGNESGKTTWMAFLRVMLYGLNTRDRSPLADKHRYLPWSGSAMQGQLDLFADGSTITVTRATTRANSPMGTFSAHFTGTAAPVPDLTAATLGETLLGIPQDIFERSAFIRQSGISIDQSAALEKRIASLITTGEEDSSYTDAADRLRKQLNRRRYNKSGLLPQLESEIAALEGSLGEINDLETTLRAHEVRRDALTEQITYYEHQLTLCAAAESAQRAAQLVAARDALSRCEESYTFATERSANLPSRDELTGIIGDLSALESTANSAQNAKNRLHTCTIEHEQAQQQLNTHPFAPQTPSQAAATPLITSQRPRLSLPLLLLSAACSVLVFLTLRFLLHLSLPAAALAAAVTAAASSSFITASTVRRQRLWDADFSRKRAAHDEALAAYTILYEAFERTDASRRAAAETYRALSTDHATRLNHVLDRVNRFHPAQSIGEAKHAVESALSLHTAADAAHRELQQAKLRFDLLAENAPPVCGAPAEVPSLSRAEAEQCLRDASGQLSQLQRLLHTLEGRCEALGDPLLLRAELEQKQLRREALQKEYDAISLASSVLDDANTALQSRFSPALGEKAASIFTKLTKGKYNKVLLDRKMTPSAQESGDILSHTALSLSQGTADQLYLAVRLAICDLVLPGEKSVPIFLDDALVTFDDARMAAALDYLVELSETRQILLFTCQRRELHYLRTAHPDRFHAVSLL